jgi:hypothetical protein
MCSLTIVSQDPEECFREEDGEGGEDGEEGEDGGGGGEFAQLGRYMALIVSPYMALIISPYVALIISPSMVPIRVVSCIPLSPSLYTLYMYVYDWPLHGPNN